MCLSEYDIYEFLLFNRSNLLNRLPKREGSFKDLSYFYNQQFNDELVKITKEFLLEHFPEHLDSIQNCVDILVVESVLGFSDV